MDVQSWARSNGGNSNSKSAALTGTDCTCLPLNRGWFFWFKIHFYSPKGSGPYVFPDIIILYFPVFTLQVGRLSCIRINILGV